MKLPHFSLTHKTIAQKGAIETTITIIALGTMLIGALLGTNTSVQNAALKLTGSAATVANVSCKNEMCAVKDLSITAGTGYNQGKRMVRGNLCFTRGSISSMNYAKITAYVKKTPGNERSLIGDSSEYGLDPIAQKYCEPGKRGKNFTITLWPMTAEECHSLSFVVKTRSRVEEKWNSEIILPESLLNEICPPKARTPIDVVAHIKVSGNQNLSPNDSYNFEVCDVADTGAKNCNNNVQVINRNGSQPTVGVTHDLIFRAVQLSSNKVYLKMTSNNRSLHGPTYDVTSSAMVQDGRCATGGVKDTNGIGCTYTLAENTTRVDQDFYIDNYIVVPITTVPSVSPVISGEPVVTPQGACRYSSTVEIREDLGNNLSTRILTVKNPSMWKYSNNNNPQGGSYFTNGYSTYPTGSNPTITFPYGGYNDGSPVIWTLQYDQADQYELISNRYYETIVAADGSIAKMMAEVPDSTPRLDQIQGVVKCGRYVTAQFIFKKKGTVTSPVPTNPPGTPCYYRSTVRVGIESGYPGGYPAIDLSKVSNPSAWGYKNDKQSTFNGRFKSNGEDTWPITYPAIITIDPVKGYGGYFNGDSVTWSLKYDQNEYKPIYNVYEEATVDATGKVVSSKIVSDPTSELDQIRGQVVCGKYVTATYVMEKLPPKPTSVAPTTPPPGQTGNVRVETWVGFDFDQSIGTSTQCKGKDYAWWRDNVFAKARKFEGGKITLVANDGSYLDSKPNSSYAFGQVMFENVPAGKTYTVQISNMGDKRLKNGYKMYLSELLDEVCKDARRSVDVYAGQTAYPNIVMYVKDGKCDMTHITETVEENCEAKGGTSVFRWGRDHICCVPIGTGGDGCGNAGGYCKGENQGCDPVTEVEVGNCSSTPLRKCCKSSGIPQPPQCNPNKVNKQGGCDPACCKYDSECPSGQKCNISNGNCNSGKSCNPNNGTPPNNGGAGVSCTTVNANLKSVGGSLSASCKPASTCSGTTIPQATGCGTNVCCVEKNLSGAIRCKDYNSRGICVTQQQCSSTAGWKSINTTENDYGCEYQKVCCIPTAEESPRCHRLGGVCSNTTSCNSIGTNNGVVDCTNNQICCIAQTTSPTPVTCPSGYILQNGQCYRDVQVGPQPTAAGCIRYESSGGISGCTLNCPLGNRCYSYNNAQYCCQRDPNVNPTARPGRASMPGCTDYGSKNWCSLQCSGGSFCTDEGYCCTRNPSPELDCHLFSSGVSCYAGCGLQYSGYKCYGGFGNVCCNRDPGPSAQQEPTSSAPTSTPSNYDCYAGDERGVCRASADLCRQENKTPKSPTAGCTQYTNGQCCVSSSTQGFTEGYSFDDSIYATSSFDVNGDGNITSLDWALCSRDESKCDFNTDEAFDALDRSAFFTMFGK